MNMPKLKLCSHRFGLLWIYPFAYFDTFGCMLDKKLLMLKGAVLKGPVWKRPVIIEGVLGS